jgi:hypothetical protein
MNTWHPESVRRASCFYEEDAAVALSLLNLLAFFLDGAAGRSIVQGREGDEIQVLVGIVRDERYSRLCRANDGPPGHTVRTLTRPTDRDGSRRWGGDGPYDRPCDQNDGDGAQDQADDLWSLNVEAGGVQLGR